MPWPPFSNISTAYDLKSANGWNVFTVATTITSPVAPCSRRINVLELRFGRGVDDVREVVDRRA